jgi:hypothetical protein
MKSVTKNQKGIVFIPTLIVVLTIGLVGFFVFQQVTQTKPSPTEIKTSPVPEKTLSEIKIVDGNVCQVTASGGVKILVNKQDYQSESISAFDKVATSPDGTKMCFLGHSPVPIWLYSANINGSNVVKVGLSKNCVWSHNSQKIAFNNHTTDVSPVDIYIYDTLSGKTDNLTQSLQSQSKADAIRFYGTPAWSEDDSEISSKFVASDMSDQEQMNGVSVINVATGKAEDTITSD